MGFHKYQRRYMRIAGWLKHKDNLSTTEVNRYFWKGLPKKTRELLRNRIEIVNPQIDSSKPYELSVIEKAAEHVFDMSRFDDEHSAAEVSVSEDSDTESSEEDSSDDENSRRKKKKKKSSSRNKAKASSKDKNAVPSKKDEDE